MVLWGGEGSAGGYIPTGPANDPPSAGLRSRLRSDLDGRSAGRGLHCRGTNRTRFDTCRHSDANCDCGRRSPRTPRWPRPPPHQRTPAPLVTPERTESTDPGMPPRRADAYLHEGRLRPTPTPTRRARADEWMPIEGHAGCDAYRPRREKLRPPTATRDAYGHADATTTPAAHNHAHADAAAHALDAYRDADAYRHAEPALRSLRAGPKLLGLRPVAGSPGLLRGGGRAWQRPAPPGQRQERNRLRVPTGRALICQPFAFPRIVREGSAQGASYTTTPSRTAGLMISAWLSL